MILARIDDEEPHYAHHAAHALRDEGVIVHIAPGLQEDIDTEWTWANYPMHWLNRDEIREVSAAGQKIHDDIASGLLYPPPHPQQPHHLAVGTYRGGKSVHLHGENHLRQAALAYDNPSEALAEFARLYGDAVRPGPMPATHIEGATAALATIAGGPMATPPNTSPERDRPAARTVPMYAGDPSDHETLLNTFLESQGEWEKYRTWSDDTTVASRQSLALRAEFVHEAGPGDINWTIAAYESPVGDRFWHATATSTTPVEMVRTLLDTLASESAWGAGLGTRVSERTNSVTTRPLADEGWKQTVDGRWIRVEVLSVTWRAASQTRKAPVCVVCWRHS